MQNLFYYKPDNIDLITQVLTALTKWEPSENKSGIISTDHSD
jgi:hypothetical protein